MVISASILTLVAVFSLVFFVQQKMITLGIPKYKQMKDHKKKEWKQEEAIIPIKIGDGVNAQMESEVRWCPQTNEIFRKKQNAGIFEKEWEEITRYSSLHKRLLRNFKNKYVRGRGNPGTGEKTDWTTLS